MLPDIKDVLKPRPRKYRNIARHLSPLLLTQDMEQTAYAEQDIFKDLTTSRGTDRFLGLFSKLGVQFSLKKFGIIDFLRNSNLPEPIIELDTSDAYKHLIRITHLQASNKLISAELVARRGYFKHPEILGYNPPKQQLDLIIIEWLMLQHPLKSFSRYRPQLPGQEHPGLGIAELIYESLYWSARRAGADGILLIPNFLHTGLFYGRQFLFPDPVRQSLIYYVEKNIRKKKSIDQITWACAEGQLINNKTGQPLIWEPAPMILPVSLEMKDYFSSPQYTRIVQEERNNWNLRIKTGYRKNYDSNWKAVQNDS